MENKQSGEEEEKQMTRQTSKGICTFCQRELSKSGMTRHLESCEQRAALHTEAGSHQKTRKTRAFHLVVEGYRLPMYWMHLEVPARTTLATLDHFLRETWLECCGHLSAFEIGGVRYYVDAEMDSYWDWDRDRKSMQVRVDEVLRPGQTCSYEYDFGSTTELIVKVISEQEVNTKGRSIQILARNNPLIVPCDVCGDPAYVW
jgi:Plasmid pRiA4b ORF-3-like protein